MAQNLKKIFLSRTIGPFALKTWYVVFIDCSTTKLIYNITPEKTLAYFYVQFNLITLGIWMRKADIFLFSVAFVL